MPVNVATSDKDRRTNKPWFRKGWTVAYDVSKGKYRAYSDSLPMVYYGTAEDKRMAISMAISGALKHGRLSWPATRAYAEMKGIDISYDDAFDFKGGTGTNRGWYVRINGSTPTCPRYEIRIGATAKTSRSVGTAKHKVKAVKIAISAAKGKRYYNEDLTVCWLRKNGMEQLIETARR